MAAAAVKRRMNMRRKMLKANKKGLNYYSPIIAIMGIFILGAILSNLFVKQNKLSADFDLGREQFRILLAGTSAEKAMLFVDNAATLSLEHAAYKYGRNGFYEDVSPCGSINSYSLWEKEVSLTQDECIPKSIGPCYPSSNEMQSTLLSFFGSNFNDGVSAFNSNSGLKVEGNNVVIPSSYGFTISPAAGRTEITGKSSQPVSIVAAKTNQLVYEIKPDFRESIAPDVISEGSEVANKAPQLVRQSSNGVNTMLNSFKSANPALQWKLDSYSSPQTSCSHNVGTCTYDCNCVTVENPCPDDNTKKCTSESCETCVGTNVETVTYTDYNAAFSVTDVASGKGFYVSDPPSAQPQLKSLDYRFGLSWLEEKSRGTACTP